MGRSLAVQLIEAHLVEGEPVTGSEIGLRVDQTLTQDATGTLAMLELEAMGVRRVATECSVQYVDHNLIQADHKNPDDHLFLLSAAQRFGLWYSRPGNGVSHPLHQAHFGVPGKSLLGSDSHTPAGGSLGMLAMGAGGLDVAAAMAGHPYRMRMPGIWGVELVGRLPEWVSAKDIILEMLRRHGVDGALGWILEYHGEGLGCLNAMDRHVIANMGTELGATTSVFPSDSSVRRYLKSQGRAEVWRPLAAEPETAYDRHEKVDLSTLEPLIAMPSSPDNVVPVREVAGEPIYQAYIGSSANPGYRDFAVAAEIVRDRQVHPAVSLDINPTSRSILKAMMRDGRLAMLMSAGARLHQAGCNGCIGMGQAPATDRISLRTVPRNFPGRSGTREDRVCLVSPETAAVSSLSGRITDPRDAERPCPRVEEPLDACAEATVFVAPKPVEQAAGLTLRKGPNIVAVPRLDPLPDELHLPVLLRLDDGISTDEILPAGTRVLPWRSNIPKISEFAFEGVDADYAHRAAACRDEGGHALVAGENYGQGSSREHAALALRYLGLRVVLARSFARIHEQNLINFGVLPLRFDNPDDARRIEPGDELEWEGLRKSLKTSDTVSVRNITRDQAYDMHHALAGRGRSLVLAGGLIEWMRAHAL